MSAKQFIRYSKLLVLLLFSNGAIANSVISLEHSRDSKTVVLYQAEDSLHKDGLQPQVPSVRIISDHHAKPISFGYPALSYVDGGSLVLGYVGTTQVLLQDANRCESVSRFLFPYHFFW